MALKFKIKALEELEEPYKPFGDKLYKKADDGSGFVLDVGGVVDVDEVHTIQRTLEHEKEQRRGATSENEKLKKDIADTQAKIKELESKGTGTGGGGGKSKELDELREQLDNQKKTYEDRIAALETANTDAQTKAKEARLGSKKTELIRQIEATGTKRGVPPKRLVDLVNRVLPKYVMNDQEEYVPMEQGKIIYGRAQHPTQPMSMDELVGNIITEADHLVGGSGGGGGGGNLSGGPQANPYTLSRAEAKDPSRYRAAKDAAAKEGRDLVITD